MTVAEWKAKLPMIEWDKPVMVSVAGVAGQRMICRVCVAEYGLAATDVERRAFSSIEEFEAHQEADHAA